jgi:hypothetical protein
VNRLPALRKARLASDSKVLAGARCGAYALSEREWGDMYELDRFLGWWACYNLLCIVVGFIVLAATGHDISFILGHAFLVGPDNSLTPIDDELETLEFVTAGLAIGSAANDARKREDKKHAEILDALARAGSLSANPAVGVQPTPSTAGTVPAKGAMKRVGIALVIIGVLFVSVIGYAVLFPYRDTALSEGPSAISSSNGPSTDPAQRSRLDFLAESERQTNAACFYYLFVPPREAAAWKQWNDDVKACTDGFSEPFPRDQMRRISDCGEQLLTEKVKPVTHSPEQFALYMAERSVDHQLYAGGKIEWSDVQDRAKQRFTRYLETGSGSYAQYADCSNDVLAEKLSPTDQVKPLMDEYTGKLSALALSADNDKMSHQEFQAKAQRLGEEFAKKYSEQPNAPPN